MVEERAHRSPSPAGVNTLPRRVRSYLGLLQEPALPRPARLRIDPVRRSWLGAFWHARISVRAGVSLDDYLRSRLARYLAGIPAAEARLPLHVDVDDGQIVVSTAAAERRAPPAAAEDADAWLAPLIAVEGPSVRQEVAEHEIQLAMLEGEIQAARRRRDELSERFASDVASGLVASAPSVEATAEQMGRPALRSSALSNALLAFAGTALAAETWQIAVPLFAAARVDVTTLAAEASRRPAEVAFVSIFALGVAAGLFALAHAALQGAAALVRGVDDARRRRWLALGSAGGAAMSLLIAGAMAATTPTAGARLPRLAYALLLVAVPLGAALVLRVARRDAEDRAAGFEAALAWDRSRAAALADRARRLDELSWAETAQRDLEAQRDAARLRLRRISARALAATRIAAEAERQERDALARVAHSVVAALELDRYEFVRQAISRGAPELVSRRRRVDPRPALLESAPAPAARHAEPGRVAV